MASIRDGSAAINCISPHGYFAKCPFPPRTLKNSSSSSLPANTDETGNYHFTIMFSVNARIFEIRGYCAPFHKTHISLSDTQTYSYFFVVE